MVRGGIKLISLPDVYIKIIYSGCGSEESNTGCRNPKVGIVKMFGENVTVPHKNLSSITSSNISHEFFKS